MCLSCYGQWQYFGVKQLQWEKSQAISNVRPKKKGRGRGGKKKKGKRLLFTACRYIDRKRGQNIFCLYRFWSQPSVLHLGCWTGVFLNWSRASKDICDKRLWRPQDLVVVSLLQHHVLEHGDSQLGHEAETRDSHVPLPLLTVCDHCTLCLSIRCFHAQSLFFRAEFLQLKEGANENIWSSFPFFRETNWFQHQGWSNCCWRRTGPSKSRRGTYSPRMSPEQLRWLFSSTTATRSCQ